MKNVLAFLLLTSSALAADPVAFLAAPRTTGFFKVQSISENFGPYNHTAGTSLVLVRDGVETVLAQGDKPGFRAVHDYCVSIDGLSIVYSHVRDTKPPTCDLFRIVIATGEVTQLTNAATEFSPPSGYWPLTEKRGVWNSGPCCTPSGIVFVSNRSGVISPAESYPANQLFRMDNSGKNVEKIGHLNIGGAAHPTLGPDGRVYFSSAEQQGWRSGRGGGWAIWSINPDGTTWGPEISAIPAKPSTSWHFQTVTSDGSLVANLYYDTRAYGTIFRCPPFVATPFGPPSPFGDPVYLKNPPMWQARKSNATRFTQGSTLQLGFQRREMHSLAPWATVHDVENLDFDGSYLGMVAHPEAIPGNGVLLTYAGGGADKTVDLGVYSISDVASMKPDQTKPLLPASHPRDLIKIVDKPDRHEWMGKPVVPFSAIHGRMPPVVTGEVADELPVGSAYGVIGSSSVNWREIVTPDGKALQQFDNAEIKWLRVLAFNATQNLTGLAKSVSNVPVGGAAHARTEGFSTPLNERTGFYETLVPLESDGSFKAIIPADHPWSVQLLNAKGEALATAQTWHQVRPREKRVNCNGCHAHNKPTPFQFADSIAGQPGFAGVKLDKIRFVEYQRDIKPIDDRLSLGLGPRPWETHASTPTAYHSLASTLDDDERLTDAEARLLRTWQDTGFLAAWQFPDGSQIPESSMLGAYADTIPPALSVNVFSDRVIIGAADGQSGLNKASLTTDPVLAGEWNGDIWTSLGKPPAVLTVSIRDNQAAPGAEVGNVTRRTVTTSQPVDPPPEPDPEVERLKVLIADLQKQLSELKAKIQAARAALE